MRTSITVMALAVLALSSCKNQPSQDTVTAPISFTTSLSDQGSQSKASTQPSDKTASVTTLNSEKFGVYITKHSGDVSQPISTSNVYDNIVFNVTSDGAVEPEKTLYFPTKTEKITTYAYFPYQADEFADAADISWSVKADQSAAAGVKSSEFLFASVIGDPAAAETPLKLEFSHALSLLQINLTAPIVFIDEQIKDFTGQAIKNAMTTASINLNTKKVTVPKTVAQITPRLVETKVLSDKEKLYTYELVLVPQTIVSGKELFNIAANFVSAGVSSRDFKYILTGDLILAQNSYHTINLKLSDYGKLELTSATVADWDNTSLVGSTGGDEVANVLSFRLLNYNKDIAPTVDNAKVTIDNEVYVFSKSKIVASGNKHLAMINITLPDNNNKMPKKYPYLVNRAQFLNISNSSVVSQYLATEVTSGGEVIIPIYDYTEGFTPGADTDDWLNGGGSLNGDGYINNNFSFRLLNYNKEMASSVDNVKITIDNEVYVFNKSKIATSGNKNLTTVTLSLPDNNNKMPKKYPYLVNRAEFLNTSNASVVSQYLATEVASEGDVIIPIYNYGGGFKPDAGTDDWTGGNGSVSVKVPVNSNFDFMYCNKAATAATACSAVNKVRLTFGTSGTKEFAIEMKGSRFAAQTLVASNFTGLTGMYYPFTITKAEFMIGTTVVHTETLSMMIKYDRGYTIAVVK